MIHHSDSMGTIEPQLGRAGLAASGAGERDPWCHAEPSLHLWKARGTWAIEPMLIGRDDSTQLGEASRVQTILRLYPSLVLGPCRIQPAHIGDEAVGFCVYAECVSFSSSNLKLAKTSGVKPTRRVSWVSGFASLAASPPAIGTYRDI